MSTLVSAFWRFSWIWIGLTALSVSTLLTAVLVKIAPARGWVVVPVENRWNRRVVAQFGGIPILLTAFTVAALLPAIRPVMNLLLLTLGITVLGLVDDIIGLGPKPKLIVQILLATLAVHSGIVHPLTHITLFNGAFTVFWIVAITNAFNLIDNIDGLAAGVAIIALAQIVLLTGVRVPVGIFAFCIMTSVGGFLFFNANPAKIFMGDVGSLPLGFFLACASVATASHLSSLGSVLLVPCLVLFIPIFDMLLVSITRRMNGRAISRGARDHTSHRLVLLGLTERQAVWILYVMAFIAGTLAFCWEKFWPEWGAGFLTLFLVGASLFWVYLAKLKLPDNWLSESNVLIIKVPAFFLEVAAKLSALVLDGIVGILAFYFACLSNLDKLGSFFLVQFWLAAIAAAVVKLGFLVACGTYRTHWSLSRWEDTLPILKAVSLAACVISVAWLVLPSNHPLPIAIILSDAGLTAALLVIIRVSTKVFDFIVDRLRSSPAATNQEMEVPPLSAFSVNDLQDELNRKKM